MGKLHLENLPVSVELVRGPDGVEFRYVDERLLPADLVMASTRDWREVVDAVKTLAVRGAPALGVAGASALALWAHSASSLDGIEQVAHEIAHARPTAVNLQWGVERALAFVKGAPAQEVPDRHSC